MMGHFTPEYNFNTPHYIDNEVDKVVLMMDEIHGEHPEEETTAQETEELKVKGGNICTRWIKRLLSIS